jgi:hypothetical protein
MESMSTTPPVEPPAQPLLTPNIQPIEAESEKENQTPAPVPVPVETIPVPISAPVVEPPVSNRSSVITIRPKVRPEANSTCVANEHKKTSSSASTSSVATLKQKNSTDTYDHEALRTCIRTFPTIYAPPSPATSPRNTSTQPPPPVVHHTPSAAQPRSIDEILANDVLQGSTLDIGIPCIISSKRKRFTAYVCYVGEVLGESGSWVGVEVPIPIGDSNWGDLEVARRRMIDSGMVVHGEGFGIVAIEWYARWLRVWRRSYGEEKENRCWECWRRCGAKRAC